MTVGPVRSVVVGSCGNGVPGAHAHSVDHRACPGPARLLATGISQAHSKGSIEPTSLNPQVAQHRR